MDDYQPNTDNAHDHTYPVQAEGVRQFDLRTSAEILRDEARNTGNAIAELQRIVTSLVMRVSILERQNEAGNGAKL